MATISNPIISPLRDLCNKRGSTRRGRTTVSSTASAPRIPVCVAIPEEPRGRRVASWRRAIVNPGSRFVSVPPTRTLPPLPSHRSCYVPGQVRGPVPPGQPFCCPFRTSSWSPAGRASNAGHSYAVLWGNSRWEAEVECNMPVVMVDHVCEDGYAGDCESNSGNLSDCRADGDATLTDHCLQIGRAHV